MEKYIKIAKEKFDEKTSKIVIKQIENFYNQPKEIIKNKYSVGEDVLLKKGTLMHGIAGDIENFDYVINNGFISTDFTDIKKANKICCSVGMWKLKDDILLKDYINLYSGITILYTKGRGPESEKVAKMIPYHKFDEETEKINNDEEIWSYTAEQTKEVRFIPSLVSNKPQIAFILNMESKYAKEIAKPDVWNEIIDDDSLKYFTDYRYYPKFIEERKNRNAIITDREAAIVFGVPACLIEGVFVGRKIENDQEKLNYIKSKLPDCYICNLDGKVIISN